MMANKSSNKNLNKAKESKKDEFYTQLSDIENELKHYKEQFKGKVVYCNCDDPRMSNFFHYFSYNFEKLCKLPYKAEHKKYRKEIQNRGAVDGDLYLMVDGVVTVPYSRIIIKNKKLESHNLRNVDNL